jgi:Tfp pilus assembly PilM family ATPase
VLERRLPLGIDLGTARIRVVALARRRNGTYRVLAGACSDVAGDHAGALRNALAELGPGERRAFFMLRSADARCKWVRLPRMGARELRATAAFEATIMYDARTDALVTRVIPGRERQESAVIAAPKDAVARIEGLAKAVRLEAAGIDYEPFALARVLEPPILDIGLERSTLVAGTPARPLVRHLSLGGNAFTVALAEEYAIPTAAAEERKRALGLGGAASACLTRFCRILEEQIDDLRDTERVAVERLRLCGNGSRLRDVADAIRQNLGIAVTPAELGGDLEATIPKGAESSTAVDWLSAIAAAKRRAA